MPVPGWIERLQAACSRNVLVGLVKAVFAPGQARDLTDEGKRLGYRGILYNFSMALVPHVLYVATFGATWWYVVIHKKSIEAPEVAGLQPLGGVAAQAAASSEEVVPQAFYIWFTVVAVLSLLGIVRYYWRMDGARFTVLKLLSSSVMPLGILTVAVLAVILFGITTATEMGGRRRRRRLPARLPGADARLEAHQGGGVPDGKDHRHGVLAVRRFGAVLGGVRHPGRPGPRRALGTVAQLDAGPVHAVVAGHHLHPRMAAGMDGDHHHFRSDLTERS